MPLTAPAAKAAILTQLGQRAALSAVAVRWGQPTEEEDVTSDMIWLGNVEIPDDDWSELGARRRRTTFTVGFTIAVRRYGDDEQATEASAWAYYDEFLSALRLDYTLGGNVQQIRGITARQSNGPMPSQWASVITGAVTCDSKAY